MEDRIDTDPAHYIYTNGIKGITVPHWSIQVNHSGEIIFHQWNKSNHIKALRNFENSSTKKHNLSK
jgi:hypothetical protein